jgi:hypothetical protein
MPCLFAVAGAPCVDVAWAMPTAAECREPTIALRSDRVDSAEPYLSDRIRGPPLA